MLHDHAADMTATVSGEVTLTPVAQKAEETPPQPPPRPLTIVELQARLDEQTTILRGMEAAAFIMAKEIQGLKRQQRKTDGRMDGLAPIVARMEDSYKRLEAEIVELKASIAMFAGQLSTLVAYMPILEDLRQQNEERKAQTVQMHRLWRQVVQRLNWAIGIGGTIAVGWGFTQLTTLLPQASPQSQAQGSLSWLPAVVVILAVALMLAIVWPRIVGKYVMPREGTNSDAPP